MTGLIQEYLDYNRRRGAREKTVDDHRLRLGYFLKFIADNYPDVAGVTEITREMVARYEHHLTSAKDGRGKVMSRERRYRYLESIRLFFKYCQREDKLIRDPAANVALPKLKKRLVRDVLTVEEMETLLKKCPGETARDLRDRAIMELLYSTGIRSDELCNIEIRDLDFDERVLFVRKGKLDKERLIPFGHSAGYWVRRYCEAARPLFPDRGHVFVFTSMSGTKLIPRILCKIIKNRVKLAGIEKKVNTHTFRHTCASHMLKGRADIRYVQQQLGHRSIQTTEKYLKIEITDLKEVHERTHPREQEEW